MTWRKHFVENCLDTDLKTPEFHTNRPPNAGISYILPTLPAVNAAFAIMSRFVFLSTACLTASVEDKMKEEVGAKGAIPRASDLIRFPFLDFFMMNSLIESSESEPELESLEEEEEESEGESCFAGTKALRRNSSGLGRQPFFFFE